MPHLKMRIRISIIKKITAGQAICRKKNSNGRRPLDNQNGQVIVELALMMPFLAVILLALVIIYELSAKQVGALEILRQEMRESINAEASGPFRAGSEHQTIWVDIPGKMKQVFNTPFITQDLEIDYYKGSYHGYFLTRYHNRGKRIRDINL
jgi:hypothetical protein